MSKPRSSVRRASACAVPLPEIEMRFSVTALTRKRSGAKGCNTLSHQCSRPQDQTPAFDLGPDMRHYGFVGLDYHRLDFTLRPR